jgi:5-formyltetrahydrofolate cyclo-ligase
LSRIRPSQNEFHNKDALNHQAPKKHGIQDQFLQHLSQKNPEAILLYYSMGKGVSVYQLSFTIHVDNGQLLAIIVHFEQNRGEVDDLIINQRRT